jgi:uridylate kinase
MPKNAKFKRVLLKISGEGFCHTGGKGIDINEIKFIAQEIVSASQTGAQLAVVVGGGNIVRGSQLSKLGVTRATADYMGMLGTVINSLALQDVIEKMGTPTRLLTAIPMEVIAEPFIRRRGIRHLEKGRVIIFAAGTGNPHFTTDTTAALRAVEINADVLLKATKVDGVYDDDPMKNPKATIYKSLSYMKVLNEGLKVMDSTSITLCMENKIPVIVFNMKKSGNILSVVKGGKIGTLIS